MKEDLAIYQHKKYWAERFGTASFLPMSRDEMDVLGWDSCDIILVTGDAYVDHPSFGMAVIGRMLEGQGFRVGIISQPDWQNTNDFMALGKPNLYFGITAGNMDSMVNRYTADKKKRSDDAYSPEGKGGTRPDRATLVYSQRCKEAYKKTPVIVGGIEASLRRLAHYDYWSDTVRRSVLVDAKADMLIYGNAERALIEVSHRLGRNEPIEDIKGVRGTVWMGSLQTMQNHAEAQGLVAFDQTQFEEEHSQIVSFSIGTNATEQADKHKRVPAKKTVVQLPSFEAVRDDKNLYAHASRVFHHHTNPHNSQPIVQYHGTRAIWMNPPPIPLETKEMDWVFGLPYQRIPHPQYAGKKIPAYDMIKFSVNIMRGCFGGCTFCSITEHEGRIIQNRSEDSILQEIEDIRDKVPEFTGSISDLGGPTANMYRLQCKDTKVEASCKRLSCVHPKVCEYMGTDHSHLTQLYKKARAIKGVKQVNIASGLRYDLAVKDPEYVKELVQHHVGGYLKIAPEHTEDEVLDVMLKPGIGAYDEFKRLFMKLSKEVGKEQYLIPYFIAAHPGSTEKTALQLALWLKRNKFKLDQVQTFIPTPMALASAMYHTGLNPLKKIKKDSEVLYIPRNLNDRRLQKAFLRYHDTENAAMLRLALKRLGREDLIGLSKNHLVFPEKHGLWRERGQQNAARKTQRSKKTGWASTQKNTKQRNAFGAKNKRK